MCSYVKWNNSTLVLLIIIWKLIETIHKAFYFITISIDLLYILHFNKYPNVVSFFFLNKFLYTRLAWNSTCVFSHLQTCNPFALTYQVLWLHCGLAYPHIKLSSVLLPRYNLPSISMKLVCLLIILFHSKVIKYLVFIIYTHCIF